MSIALLFWILMILWFFFGLWSSWPLTSASARPLGGGLVLFVLLAILGWQVFGPAIHR